MTQQDYYDLLGVTHEADADALKKAYRKKAMQYHPDRNPGDEKAEAKFKELSMAYDVLRDPEKRAAYDRFGPAAFDGSGPDAGGFDFASSFADVFDDLFGEFMGTRRRSTGARRGDDLRYNLEITLDDAYRGSTAQIRVPSTVGCEDCGATGAEAGSEPVTCPTCQGAGRVRAQQGFFTIERTCPSCGGAGRVIENPCQACGGSGQVYKERSLSVDVPAGVEDGTRIRLAGEGAAGMRGGPPGDLYIFLSMAPHRIFNRDGLHLYCTVPIPMADAALGGTIEVPTPEGTRSRINIPAGTQNGRQFRLKGKGMPVLRGQGRGDLYIQTLVETPVNLSKRQKDLLREFQAESTGHRNSPETEGFFARVKELWDDLTD